MTITKSFSRVQFLTLCVLLMIVLISTLQASDLSALEGEVSRIQGFFAGKFFKAGMALGTVIGILRSIHQGSIGLGLTTAGIGIGGYSLLSWITT